MNRSRPTRRRVGRPALRVRATALAVLATGCIGSSPSATMPASGSRAFGAALAHVAVVNHTPYRLSIAYRAAAGAGREVGIGSIDAGARSRLAPVPAGEAIILIARAEGVGELVLDARSFALDQRWVWDIPADARFRGSHDPAAAPPPWTRR